MATNDASKQEAAKKKVIDFIMKQMKQGASNEDIVTKLTEAGIEESQATRLVDAVYNQAQAATEQEQLSASSIIIALVAAIVAALLGGVLWGIIVNATDYEIGFMATGIGMLTGFAVTVISGKRGLPLQVIAVISALVGIGIGKYLTFYSILKDYIAELFGAAEAGAITVFSPDVISFFFDNFIDLASPYDILWVILAVVAAWRIPKALGVDLAKED